jgi:hypothetical protein
MVAVRFTSKSFSQVASLALLAAAFVAGDAAAQSVNAQQWQGTTAVTRQPEQVIAGTMAEWRSLWSRVGQPAPDVFEPGRTEAVGIFLGGRASTGYGVNILSAARRRDRIIVVFEERAPANVMTAQPSPGVTARAISTSPVTGFAAGGGPAASLPPIPYRPAGPPTSPWAILLLPRADLPITVEQRLFMH